MPDLAVPQLTERDARKLVAKINSGIDDVTSLVVQLYSGKGWAALGHASWAACCKEEFGHSASWATRQIKAAAVRNALPNGNDLPESHARELAKLPEEQRQEVLERATEATGGAVTAAAIREAAKPTCPNCGGTEFDEDGDCCGCREPAVIEAEVVDEPPAKKDGFILAIASAKLENAVIAQIDEWPPEYHKEAAKLLHQLGNDLGKD